MAWIKVENCTPDKPEIFRIADHLNIDPDAALGKLIRVWIWADSQTYDGNAHSVTQSLIDRVAGVTGFASAMIRAGWLSEIEGGFAFVNFDRHNGQTAKTRALTSKRVQKHRNATSNATSVTSALPDKRREEKIRITKETKAKKGTFVRPSVDDIRDYCQDHGIDPEHFHAYYEANGWRVGRNAMKDWKAAVRTWERNGAARKPPPDDFSKI